MKQKRYGHTVVTSVSVSKEFAEIIKQHNINPTQAFRKGIAVELYDKGVLKYSNPLNRERLNIVNAFLEDVRKEKEKTELIDNLKTHTSALLELLNTVKEETKLKEV